MNTKDQDKQFTKESLFRGLLKIFSEYEEFEISTAIKMVIDNAYVHKNKNCAIWLLAQRYMPIYEIVAGSLEDAYQITVSNDSYMGTPLFEGEQCFCFYEKAKREEFENCTLIHGYEWYITASGEIVKTLVFDNTEGPYTATVRVQIEDTSVQSELTLMNIVNNLETCINWPTLR